MIWGLFLHLVLYRTNASRYLVFTEGPPAHGPEGLLGEGAEHLPDVGLVFFLASEPDEHAVVLLPELEVGP